MSKSICAKRLVIDMGISNAYGLEVAISKLLTQYAKEIEGDLENVAKVAADECAEDLRASSPKKTGEYAAGWAVKSSKKGYVVYNKDKPGLTHLLERGHALKSGGRAPAYVHIKPAEQRAIRRFEELITETIQKGG